MNQTYNPVFICPDGDVVPAAFVRAVVLLEPKPIEHSPWGSVVTSSNEDMPWSINVTYLDGREIEWLRETEEKAKACREELIEQFRPYMNFTDEVGSFKWAAEQMTMGKKVRRRDWMPTASHIRECGGKRSHKWVYVTQAGAAHDWDISRKEFESKDWEVVSDNE